MACRKGSVNYKNEVFIQIIGKILTNGEYGWQVVAMAYRERTKEEALHDCMDVKNLCTKMKKLTGWTGVDGNWIIRYIAIEKENHEENSFGDAGLYFR
jgi:hypothetical protein